MYLSDTTQPITSSVPTGPSVWSQIFSKFPDLIGQTLPEILKALKQRDPDMLYPQLVVQVPSSTTTEGSKFPYGALAIAGGTLLALTFILLLLKK